jgi:competence CoiA-like predicted nuclease
MGNVNNNEKGCTMKSLLTSAELSTIMPALLVWLQFEANGEQVKMFEGHLNICSIYGEITRRDQIQAYKKALSIVEFEDPIVSVKTTRREAASRASLTRSRRHLGYAHTPKWAKAKEIGYDWDQTMARYGTNRKAEGIMLGDDDSSAEYEHDDHALEVIYYSL